MPIYEYRCTKCEHVFEYLARNMSDGASSCPSCGADKPEKLLSGFNPGASSSSLATPCASGACPAGPSASSTCATGGCPLK